MDARRYFSRIVRKIKERKKRIIIPLNFARFFSISSSIYIYMYKSSFLFFFKLVSSISASPHTGICGVFFPCIGGTWREGGGRAVNFFETLKHLSSHSRLESHQTMEASLKAGASLSLLPLLLLLLASFLSLFGLPTWLFFHGPYQPCLLPVVSVFSAPR